MTYPNRYAVIKDGVVINIIQLEHKDDGSDIELGNQICKLSYGEDSYVVDCNQYMCCIGDTYDGTYFYGYNENGDKFQIDKEPTDEEEFEILTKNTEIAYDILADIIGGAL